jgi:hypothetical protein
MPSFDDNKLILWFSRLLRWTLGAIVLGMGIYSRYDWYSISFGIILIVTGFLNPKRCVDDTTGNC